CSSSTSGNHGLSSWFTWMTIDLGGGPLSPRNMLSTGSVVKRRFQDQMSLEPGLRTVGTSRSMERWETVFASSIQAMSMPSVDFTLSGLVRSPPNRNSVPLGPSIEYWVDL